MAIAAIVFIILASSPSLIDAWAMTQYPATVEEISDPKIDLASHRIGSKYRTLIRRTVAEEGVNFAGKYTIVRWGCGTNCTRFAIVNLRTGAIWHDPRLIATRGLSFRRYTRILEFNPDDLDDRFPRIKTEYLEWTGTSLRNVKAPKTAG